MPTLSLEQHPRTSSGGGGNLPPPPPQDPEQNRWRDDESGPYRALAALMAFIQAEFAPHPWFSGVASGSFKRASSDAGDPAASPRLFDTEQVSDRTRGIVLIVLDRSPEQIAEIKAKVNTVLVDCNATFIPFAVHNRDPIQECIEYEAAEEQRKKDLELLRSTPELAKHILTIETSRHPLGTFWIVVTDSLSDTERTMMQATIGRLIDRRFQIYSKSMWESILGPHRPPNRS